MILIRNLRRIGMLGAAVMALAAPSLPAAAQNAFYDFEGFPGTAPPFGGIVLGLSTTDNGITMSITRPGSSFDIVDNTALGQTGKPASWGDRSLAPFFDTGATPMLADFSLPIYSFSVEMGDYFADSDTLLSVEAYSGLGGTGALVGSATASYGTNGFPTIITVGVTGPGAQSVKFIGGSVDFPNSLFYDNIKVSTVPEPGSLAMLFAGAAPFGFYLRRRVRNR
jgi:hypothetical protein